MGKMTLASTFGPRDTTSSLWRCAACAAPVAPDEVVDLEPTFCADCQLHGTLDDLSELWDDLGRGA